MCQHEGPACDTVQQTCGPNAEAASTGQHYKVLTAAAACDQAHGELEAATRSVLRKDGLQMPDSFVHKTVQLHETLGVRFGVMVVGPTGTGKSTLLRTLQVIPSSPLLHLIPMCAMFGSSGTTVLLSTTMSSSCLSCMCLLVAICALVFTGGSAPMHSLGREADEV